MKESYQVPVSFVSVELDGEASRVPDGVRRAGLAADGAEPDEEGRRLADRREHGGLIIKTLRS